MLLHILVFMTHSPILEGELLHTVFEFLRPTLDTAAFLVAAMLNAFKLVVGKLGFVPIFHIEVLERSHLLFQSILLRAGQSQLGLGRIDINHCLFIFRLTDTADHCNCADHHDRRDPP